MGALNGFLHLQGFSSNEANDIAGKFISKKLKKGELFVEEGKTSKYLGFIESGLMQYYILRDGEEKTTYAVGENNFVASLISFLKQTPSLEYIRAAVDTSLCLITRSDVTDLQNNIPSFKSFYVSILEWQICCIDESRLDAIMLNALQRYKKLLVKEPQLILQLPQQYLASILGVTPRHLSRIRNSIHREHL